NGRTNGNDEAKAVVVNDSGYVIVTGYADTGNGKNYLTVCYSNNGSPHWNAYFDGAASGIDMANAMAIDDEGAIIVAGQTETDTPGVYNYTIVRYETIFAPYIINYVNDTIPRTLASRIFIRFNKEVLVNPEHYNNENKIFGSLSEFISGSTLTAMKNKITEDD